MIHYHGTPITPIDVATRALRGRHAMVSFAHPEQIDAVAEVCQSFVLDNGAFSAWKRGAQTDWPAYADWASHWGQHPGCDWAIIPDEIEGDEAANDDLIDLWAEWAPNVEGVPVWHYHESIARLERLASAHRRVALGSSGDYAVVGTNRWWARTAEAMAAICDEHGRPRCKLHGLRMLDPTVFSHLPLASADSTNVARNVGIDSRWTGPYVPASKTMRALVIMDRVEAHASAMRWCNTSRGVKQNRLLFG